MTPHAADVFARVAQLARELMFREASTQREYAAQCLGNSDMFVIRNQDPPFCGHT